MRSSELRRESRSHTLAVQLCDGREVKLDFEARGIEQLSISRNARAQHGVCESLYKDHGLLHLPSGRTVEMPVWNGVCWIELWLKD